MAKSRRPKSSKSSGGKKKSSHRSGSSKKSSSSKRSGSSKKSNSSGRSGPPRSRDGRRPREVDSEIRLNKSALQQLDKAIEKTHQQIADWLDQSKSMLEKVRAPKVEKGIEAMDEWQQKAFNALQEGKNVIVDAPTTAGKTRVVENFFKSHIDDPNFRAAYTTPVKSLSNDKLREFRETFGRDKVGIATGDVKENLNAPIVVTTLETYRNSLLGVDPDLNRNLVIFDEYHFMADGSRGSAWEEAIILTPDKCQLLMLSASVENGEEFVDWVNKIHGRSCEFVQTKYRPVPLTNLVYFKDNWISADEMPEQAIAKKQKGTPLPITHKLLAPRLEQLIDLKLTPCIIYAGRRKSTESIVFELSKVLDPLPEAQRARIGDILQKEDAETSALSFIDQKLRRLMQSYGVAYHHSGMPPAARLAVEALLKNGELRFCAATMGLSIGINFSVRSALISDFQRPGEQGFSRYAASEILQMLGRAGRRGRDVIGFSCWPSMESYMVLSKAKRNRCDSMLKNDPTTFLGLIAQGLNEKNIEQFYAKSFRRHGDSGIDLGLVRANRITSKLDVKKLPCDSPAFEYTHYMMDDPEVESKCRPCELKAGCHRYIEVKSKNDLAALQIHLNWLGTLSNSGTLSPYGEIAKHFPQGGGLLLAKYLAHQDHSEINLIELAELMASLSLARFKSPGAPDAYRFPFDGVELEKQLEEFYPIELFEELYDPPFGRRDYPVIREFNPDAAFAIRAWTEGMPWNELVATITNEKFGTGDLVSLIYRVASYMQSLSQANLGDISRRASEFREEMLREPISIKI